MKVQIGGIYEFNDEFAYIEQRKKDKLKSHSISPRLYLPGLKGYAI
jgi:hypothetical protein